MASYTAPTAAQRAQAMALVKDRMSNEVDSYLSMMDKAAPPPKMDGEVEQYHSFMKTSAGASTPNPYLSQLQSRYAHMQQLQMHQFLVQQQLQQEQLLATLRSVAASAIPSAMASGASTPASFMSSGASSVTSKGRSRSSSGASTPSVEGLKKGNQQSRAHADRMLATARLQQVAHAGAVQAMSTLSLLQGSTGASSPYTPSSLASTPAGYTSAATVGELASLTAPATSTKKRVLLEPKPIRGDVKLLSKGTSRILQVRNVLDLADLCRSFGKFGSIKVTVCHSSQGTCSIVAFNTAGEAANAVAFADKYKCAYVEDPLVVLQPFAPSRGSPALSARSGLSTPSSLLSGLTSPSMSSFYSGASSPAGFHLSGLSTPVSSMSLSGGSTPPTPKPASKVVYFNPYAQPFTPSCGTPVAEEPIAEKKQATPVNAATAWKTKKAVSVAATRYAKGPESGSKGFSFKRTIAVEEKAAPKAKSNRNRNKNKKANKLAAAKIISKAQPVKIAASVDLGGIDLD